MPHPYVRLVGGEGGQPPQPAAKLQRPAQRRDRSAGGEQQLEQRRDHRLLVVDLVCGQVVAVVEEPPGVAQQLVAHRTRLRGAAGGGEALGEVGHDRSELEGQEVLAAGGVVAVHDRRRQIHLALIEQEPGEPREVVEPCPPRPVDVVAHRAVGGHDPCRPRRPGKPASASSSAVRSPQPRRFSCCSMIAVPTRSRTSDQSPQPPASTVNPDSLSKGRKAACSIPWRSGAR